MSKHIGSTVFVSSRMGTFDEAQALAIRKLWSGSQPKETIAAWPSC
jgi:hypothetical protein